MDHRPRVPEINIESYCECIDLDSATALVKLNRLTGESETLVHFNSCTHHPFQLFFGLVMHGFWSTDFEHPSEFCLSIVNTTGRSFHVDVINLNKAIRDRIVKLSDEKWAGALNDLSVNSSTVLLDSSLAKEWRRIFIFIKIFIFITN
jgi:hypothetical protein